MTQRLRWIGRVAVLLANAAAPLAAQSGGSDLARYVALYRAGRVADATDGLQGLIRTAVGDEQRALYEYHLGLALLRGRSNDAAGALRRAAALDPDLRPDTGATQAERSAFLSARAELPIPSSIDFVPSTAVPEAGELIGVIVRLPDAKARGGVRVRARGLRGPRDTVTLFAGQVGSRIEWDGTLAGTPAPPGPLPVVVEVADDQASLTILWRLVLEVTSDAVSEPLTLRERPTAWAYDGVVSVQDRERRATAVRRGVRIAAISGTLALATGFGAAGVAQWSPPESGPRILAAALYGATLIGTSYGAWSAWRAATREREAVYLMADESVLRRNRAALEQWRADSVRVSALNQRLSNLRRLTVRTLRVPTP